MSDRRERILMRLHCLDRLEKLQAKLEQPRWHMSADKEVELLTQIQTVLTLMLHELGVERAVAEDRDSNHPPAKPGAFASEPLKAAIGALRDPMI